MNVLSMVNPSSAFNSLLEKCNLEVSNGISTIFNFEVIITPSLTNLL